MINSMKSIYLVNKFVHDILPKVDKEIYYHKPNLPTVHYTFNKL